MASVPASCPRPPQAAVRHLLPLPLQLQLVCRLRRLPLPQLGLSAAARRGEALPRAAEGGDGRAAAKEEEVDEEDEEEDVGGREAGEDDGAREAEGAGAARGSGRFAADYISLGIREPVYEVVEVKANGSVSTEKISRRQLLKSSGLRLRDTRSVDPSLWLMNSMPSLLVREQAILLNLGSLRAIAMHERVLIFNYNRSVCMFVQKKTYWHW
uniref:Uncharacterized protein n=1 Tax=Triticum urartu TaxID=4572 RepID=A0A8R7Q1F8_TRIUA